MCSSDWYETPSELSPAGPAPRPHPDGPCRDAAHGCAVCAQMERLYHVGRDAAARSLAVALEILREEHDDRPYLHRR